MRFVSIGMYKFVFFQQTFGVLIKSCLKWGDQPFFLRKFFLELRKNDMLKGMRRVTIMNQCNFGGKMIINQMCLDSFDINVLAKQCGTVAA